MAKQVENKAEAFFHGEKPEHPSTGTGVGTTPSAEKPDHRENKQIPTEPKSPGTQSVEEQVKQSLKQADEYGEELSVDQKKPQSLDPAQHPFGAPADSGVKEPREPISLFNDPAA